MQPWVNDTIELAVGIVCLGAGIAAWRKGMRLLAVVLIVAGAAAVGHASISSLG